VYDSSTFVKSNFACGVALQDFMFFEHDIIYWRMVNPLKWLIRRLQRMTHRCKTVSCWCIV